MLKSVVVRVLDSAKITYRGDTIDIPYGPLNEIVDLVNKGITKLILDFGEVDYFNSSGISTLIATEKIVNDNGARMAICNLQPQVEKVIKLTKTDNILSCFDTEGDAARYVGLIKGDVSAAKREEIVIIEAELEISESLQSIFDEFKHLLMYKITSTVSLDLAYEIAQDYSETGLIMLDVYNDPIKLVDFLEHLRTGEVTRYIPVIVVTDEDNIQNAHYFIRNGADDMLRFPMNKHETEARIRFAMCKKAGGC